MADRYPYQSEAVGARDNRTAARSSESDPLAELARLIGQTDPNSYGGRTSFGQRTKYQDHAHQPQYQDEPQYEDHPSAQVEQEPAPPSWMRTAQGGRQQQPSIQPA